MYTCDMYVCMCVCRLLGGLNGLGGDGFISLESKAYPSYFLVATKFVLANTWRLCMHASLYR